MENKTSKECEKKLIKRNSSSLACGFHCIKIKNFGVKIGQDVIIDDVNLHIHCGQLTTIIGRNGAGKTTLMKALLNEVKHEGYIEFRDVKKNTFSDLKIGYVPQHLNIEKNTPTSVYDLFASFISKAPVFLFKSKKTYQKIKEQLAQFAAEDLIDKTVCDLSGGEMQRVLLSLATYNAPHLLILDEPVSGMDHNGMNLFYENIDYLKKHYDLAVILISHDLEYVAKYSDQVVLLDKTIIRQGAAKEVFHSKEFKDTFGNVKYLEEDN